jgi:hypothetical protein
MELLDKLGQEPLASGHEEKRYACGLGAAAVPVGFFPA